MREQAPATHSPRGEESPGYKNDPRIVFISSFSILLVAEPAERLHSTHDLEPTLVVASVTRQQHLRYCLLLVLLPLLAVPACIAFGASNYFLHHGASIWVRANDAVFDMRDRDCEVLVFGDSTAMTGLDPDLLAAETSLRTCNIAVTNAVLAVTGNLPLDHYLAANRSPRILLVQLAPDGFEAAADAWHQTIYAEGMLELLRHGDRTQVRRMLLLHPRESIAFAGYAAGFGAWYLLREAWSQLSHRRPEEDTPLVRNGFFTAPLPARTSCHPPDLILDRDDPHNSRLSRELVDSFKRRYASHAEVVLVNVAPIPACDGNLAAYQAALHGVTSNSLQTLPIALFNDDRHYTAAGARVVSAAAAQEVNTVAGQSSSPQDRMPSSHSVALLHRMHLPPPYRHGSTKP